MMQGLSTPVPVPNVDIVVVVATVVSKGAGVGAGVIASTIGVSVGVLVGAATLTSSGGVGRVVAGQHEILYMLLSAMHVGDPDSFSVDELISSKHVIEFPLDAFGTKSLPAVMPFGQMMHGLSILG
jgi:hypothetical protein